jgi:hypothetical protein
MLLHHTPTRYASILDHAEVPVVFAVFESTLCSQKHANRYLTEALAVQ